MWLAEKLDWKGLMGMQVHIQFEVFTAWKIYVCYGSRIGRYQHFSEVIVSIIRLEVNPKDGSSSAFRIRLRSVIPDVN